MRSITLLTLAAIGIGCTPMESRSIHSYPQHTLAIDIDEDGSLDIVHFSDHDSLHSVSDGRTAIFVSDQNQGSPGQESVPGSLISAVAITPESGTPTQVALVTLDDGRLLIHLIGRASGTAIWDSLAVTTIPVFREVDRPPSSYAWDPALKGVQQLGPHSYLAHWSSGHSAYPRGLTRIDVSRGQPRTAHLELGVPISTVLIDSRGDAIFGTYAPSNDDSQGPLSDSESWAGKVDLATMSLREPPLMGSTALNPMLWYRSGGALPDTLLLERRRNLGLHVFQARNGKRGRLLHPSSVRSVRTVDWDGDAIEELILQSADGEVIQIGNESERPLGVLPLGFRLTDASLSLSGSHRTWLLACGESGAIALDHRMRIKARFPGCVARVRTLDNGRYLVTSDLGVEVVSLARPVPSKASVLWGAFFLVLGLLAGSGMKFHLGRHRDGQDILANFRAESARSLLPSATGGFPVLAVAIRSALAIYEEDPAFGVDQFAQAVGLASSRELNEVLKHHTGLTARQVIENHRIARAKERLIESGDTVDVVAASLGYRSPQYFATRFKRTVGVTPSDFRNAKVEARPS